MNIRRRMFRQLDYQNEVAILGSSSLIRKAIEELDFKISYFEEGRIKTTEQYKNSPFIVILTDTSNLRTGNKIYIKIRSSTEYYLSTDEWKSFKKMRFGEEYIDDDYRFKTDLTGEYNNGLTSRNFHFIINDLERLSNLYQSKYAASTRDERSSIIDMSAVGFIPEKEADFINKLIEVFIRTSLEEKNQTNVNTMKFIDEQLSTLFDSLQKDENELVTFQILNKVTDISKESNELFSNLNDLNQKKAELTVKLNYLDYLDNYIINQQKLDQVVFPSVIGISEGPLSNQITKLVDLYATRENLLLSTNETNPKVLEKDAAIQSALEALKENIINIRANYKLSMYDIDTRIGSIDKIFEELPLIERNLLTLKRKLSLNDNIYNYLLQRKAEAGIAKAANISNVKILEPANSRKAIPISPNRSQNKIAAILLGLLIPVLIVIGKEMLNDKINEKKDIENQTKTPILGVISHNYTDFEIPVYEKPRSSLAESFRALRTNIQYFASENSQKVFTISSTVSGEGKTFCALNLAAIFAMSDKKTILLGLDLRKPKLHKVFEIPNDKGLSTYLINKHTKEEIIYKTYINNLYFAPSGPVPPNPTELIETTRLKTLIDSLRLDFDIIIIDTPPVAIVSDALLINKESDLLAFVVRQNYSSKEVLKLVDDLYTNKNMKNISLVVNDLRLPGYYGYGYHYGYGYGYNYGYAYGYGKGYYEDDEVLEGNFLVRKIKKLFS